MALSHFPLAFLTNTSSSSPPLRFLHLQPQHFSSKTSFRVLEFRGFYSHHSTQLDTRESKPIKVAVDYTPRKKKKRPPKPSFFEEIRYKWSSRTNRLREKLPWQVHEDPIQQQQRQQYHEEEEKEDEDDDKAQEFSSGFPLSAQDDDKVERFSSGFSLSGEDDGKNEILSSGFRLSELDHDKVEKSSSGLRLSGVEDDKVEIFSSGLRLSGVEDDKVEIFSSGLRLSDPDDDKVQKFSSGFDLSDAEADVRGQVPVSDPVSFPKPSRFISAPWAHGTIPGKHKFDSEQEILNFSSDNVAKVNRYGGVYGYEDSIVNDVAEEASDLDNEIESEGEEGMWENKESFGDRGGNGVVAVKEKEIWRRNNTKLAERTIPEHELKRLRNVSLRMLERFKVGSAGITQALVEAIHEKWKLDEVVKLKFEKPLSLNMRRTHQILENKTGGVVIWRSGSSAVLYRGMTYKLPCVQSFTNQNLVSKSTSQLSKELSVDILKKVGVSGSIRTKESSVTDFANHSKEVSKEELIDLCELNHLLDELGPRFQDWTGCEPLPVDADLLPPVVPGYKTPFRLLPHGVRPCLCNKEMTNLRRVARTMPPHFALGRNRQLQGLAKAMVKLWEQSALAKIAIKRGVENTRNERMAEELKRLTGGVLLSRNKEYIVFYRGNDFLPPIVVEALTEREKELTEILQFEEDKAREKAATTVASNARTSKAQSVAGTLAETIAATSRWGPEPSSVDVEELKREAAELKRTLLIGNLKQRLIFAKRKLRRAEKALAKVQEDLEPSELPNDLEVITDEERFLFRKIGLSMKPYLLLGRREVYDGTIENMHLHWKHRELVKIIVRGKRLPQVKHIAISLEAESGGVLVSVDKTTKGYAIIVYRGKNYRFPHELRPKNLLSKRQALAQSIELQRREALKHHIMDLEERIELLESGQMETEEKADVEDENLYLRLHDSDLYSEDVDEEEPEQESS